jgi:hypothetical protein
LKRQSKAGKIALFSSLGGVYLANFSYQKTDNPTFVIKEKRSVQDEPKAIKDWEVSNTFDFKNITPAKDLDKGFINKAQWQKAVAANDGLVNIAKYAVIGKENDTVFLKYVLNSKSAQNQSMTFGYSDEVIIYHNSKPLYQGHNRFLSRDYRYLGTIGYFDTVILPLKKGKNEIIVAVKENFGGWGFQAKLE